jgi:hypothetical protein
MATLGTRGALSLLAALLLPTFSVATVDDAGVTLTVADRVELPPETASEITGTLGALLSDTSQVSQFRLQADRANVCEYEENWKVFRNPVEDVRVGMIPRRAACYPLTDLALTLLPDGSRGGWAGFYPSPQATIAATSSAGQPVEPRTDSTLTSREGDGVNPAPDPGPSSPSFFVRVKEDHLATAVRGRVEASGAGALKIMGLDLRADARENSTDHRTGTTEEAGAVRHQTVAWLYVQFENATWSLATGAPLTLATQDIRARSTGTVHFRALDKVVRLGDVEYSPHADGDEASGALAAALAPSKDTPGAATLRLQGQFTTSMVRVAEPPGSEASWLPLGVGLVASGGLVTGGLLLYRRRARRGRPSRARRVRPDPHADVVAAAPAILYGPTYEEQAEEAAEANDYGAAAALAGRARRDRPASKILALKEGVYLLKAGAAGEAVRAFDTAARLGDDGEAEFWAALCSARLRRDDVAELYIARALDRAPSRVVLDLIESSPDLARVVERSSVQSAIGIARNRLPHDDEDV